MLGLFDGAHVWHGRDDYLTHLAVAKCSQGWGTVVVKGEPSGSAVGTGWRLVGQRRAGDGTGGCRHARLPPISSVHAPPAPPPGIIANMLVCYAVWLGNAARDATGKIIGIYM